MILKLSEGVVAELVPYDGRKAVLVRLGGTVAGRLPLDGRGFRTTALDAVRDLHGKLSAGISGTAGIRDWEYRPYRGTWRDVARPAPGLALTVHRVRPKTWRACLYGPHGLRLFRTDMAVPTDAEYAALDAARQAVGRYLEEKAALTAATLAPGSDGMRRKR